MREKIIFKEVSDEKLDELIDAAVNNLRGNTYEGRVAAVYLAEKTDENQNTIQKRQWKFQISH